MSEEGFETDIPDYVAYQNTIAEEHLAPFLREHGLLRDGPFLDIGCGQGGFSIALAARCGLIGHGVDIDPDSISTARDVARRLGVSVEFSVADLLEDPLPDRRYPLLLLRDVIEHVADPFLALRRLRELVTEDGALYVTFPPWLGPYAGHQHNARSFLRFVPYLHAVAPRLFLRLAHRLESDRDSWLADERQIVANRLTMRRFERGAADAGWSIDLKRTYLIRPALMRLGLPPVRNGWIGRLPFVGEVFTTGCEYLLRQGSQRSRSD